MVRATKDYLGIRPVWSRSRRLIHTGQFRLKYGMEALRLLNYTHISTSLDMYVCVYSYLKIDFLNLRLLKTNQSVIWNKLNKLGFTYEDMRILSCMLWADTTHIYIFVSVCVCWSLGLVNPRVQFGYIRCISFEQMHACRVEDGVGKIIKVVLNLTLTFAHNHLDRVNWRLIQNQGKVWNWFIGRILQKIPKNLSLMRFNFKD